MSIYQLNVKSTTIFTLNFTPLSSSFSQFQCHLALTPHFHPQNSPINHRTSPLILHVWHLPTHVTFNTHQLTPKFILQLPKSHPIALTCDSNSCDYRTPTAPVHPIAPIIRRYDPGHTPSPANFQFPVRTQPRSPRDPACFPDARLVFNDTITS